MAKKKRRSFKGERLYLTTFGGNKAMLDRIGTILAIGVDPAPGTSNSAPMEAVLFALVNDQPEPMEVEQLNERVAESMAELFHLRDAM